MELNGISSVVYQASTYTAKESKKVEEAPANAEEASAVYEKSEKTKKATYDGKNPKVDQATIDKLKEQGLWLYAADMGGESYWQTDFKGPVGLVVGSEGFGVSRLVREKCDFIVSIPLFGRINSMNVSCATATIAAEIARQRNS